VTRRESVIAWSIVTLGGTYGLFLIAYAICRG
jgi:hypothetical protein